MLPAVVRRICALAAAIATVAALSTWPPPRAATRADAAARAERDFACRNRFELVPAASAGTLDALYGVAGASADDVWAVGSSEGPGRPLRALIEHWDGTAWSVTPSPAPPSPSILFSVAAIAPDDAWAVGTQVVPGNVTQTLAMHWDGAAWSIVPTPNTGFVNNFIYSVAAAAPDDVWAVGTTASSSRALALRWDGVAWSIVTTPDTGAGTRAILSDVAVVGPDDIWAVGTVIDNNTTARTLVEHWDGAAWSIVPSPSGAGTSSQLYALAARNGHDILAVGFSGTGATTHTLAERWDGRAWTIVESDDAASTGANILRDVALVTNNDAWAVGYTQSATGVRTAVVERWDGHRWRLARSPQSGAPGTFLNAAGVAGHRTVWAVGGTESVTGPPFTAAPLAERRCKGAAPR